jgi:hypothetical protein
MFMSHIKSRHDIINFSEKKNLSRFGCAANVKGEKNKKILTSINFCTNRSAIMNAWDVNKCFLRTIFVWNTHKRYYFCTIKLNILRLLMRHYGWAFLARATIIKQDLGNIYERLFVILFVVLCIFFGGVEPRKFEVRLLSLQNRLFN